MCPNGISVEKYCPSCGQRFAAGDETVKCWADDTILLPVSRDEFIGKVVADKFQLLQLIGAGASSLVYRALQVDLGRTVAFKLLRTDLVSNALKIQRFSQEARLVARLDHPNICRVFDFGILSSGQPYLVLELVDGTSLSSVLKTEKLLPVPRAVRLMNEIALGLQEAHAHGIMHRDLKPGNIMVVTGKDDESVKIVDFGLAKAFDAEREEQLSSSGYLIGTPSYMSPEQVVGHSLDARTDIYSLGCIFYEMLTGKKAVEGQTAFEIMGEHLRNRPHRLKYENLDIPPAIQEIALKCMQREADQRYQSVQELLAALSDLSKPRRRLRPAQVVGGILALAATAAILHFAFHPLSTPGPDLRAQKQNDSASAMLAELSSLERSNELDRAEALGKRAFQWLKTHGRLHSAEMVELGRTMRRIYGREVRTQESAVFIKAVLEAQLALAADSPRESRAQLLCDAWREASLASLDANADREALGYLKQWLALTEIAHGRNSAQCIEPLRKLCQAESNCRLQSDADRDCARLLSLCQSAYAANDPMQLSVAQDACSFYLKLGEFRRASQLADRSIDLSAGADAEKRTRIYEKAALCAASCQEYKKASRLIQRALQTHRLGGAQRDDLQLLVLQGRYLRQSKQYSEAETVARKAVLQAAAHSTDSNLYKWALEEYTKVLIANGKRSQAASIRLSGKLD